VLVTVGMEPESLTEKLRQGKFDEVVDGCSLDFEVIEKSLSEVPEKAVELLERLIVKFDGQEGANYLRIILVSKFEDNKIHDEHIAHILKSIIAGESRKLATVDLVPLCYAFLHVMRTGDPDNLVNACKPILLLNNATISDLFPKDDFPDLFPKDEQGRPPPPRAIGKAPPKPVIEINRQQRATKRALPGYTPGWLAEEYAKKHNI